MTPRQVLAVAAIGGLTALLGLAVLTALAIGLYTGTARLIDIHDAHRERRRTLTDYRRQLDALPTTTHPKER